MANKRQIIKGAVITVGLIGLALAASGKGILTKLFGDALHKAFDLVKLLEGQDGYQGNGTYKAVGDITGVATIGYGSTSYPNGLPVLLGDTCTEAQAVIFMEYEATNCYNQITKSTHVFLNPNQLAALVSFAYNEGITGLLDSTLWSKLQAGNNISEVAAEFDRWIYAGGVVVQGLINRRDAEKQYFLS